jgi:hypothetical protein
MNASWSVPMFSDTTCCSRLVMNMNAVSVIVCGKCNVRKLSGAVI